MKFIKLFFLITVVLITYNARVYSQKVPTISLTSGIEGITEKKDECKIFFVPDNSEPPATDGLDASYDMEKMLNTDPQIPNIFSIIYDELAAKSFRIQNNGLPELLKDRFVTLGYKVNNDTLKNYYISVEFIKFSPDVKVYLVDSSSLIVQELTANPKYNFWFKANNPEKRFYICFDALPNGQPTSTFTVTSPVKANAPSTITFTGNGSATGTYEWDFDGGIIKSGSGQGPYEVYWENEGTKNVSLIVKELCCQVSTKTTVSVIVKPAEVDAIITPQGPTDFCEGGSVVLETDYAAGYTYEWKKDDINIPGATNSSYTATQSGSYVVDITYIENTSTSPAVVVTVNPMPTASATPVGSTVFCEGDGLILNANTGTDYKYQWKKDDIDITDATESTYKATITGDYSVAVTSAFNCTSVSVAIKTTSKPSPVANITPDGATAFCQGGSVNLNANFAADLTYVWKKDGSVISNETMSTFNANQTGAYVVETTNSFSCTTASTLLNVTVNLPPTATATPVGSTSICEGSSLTINANTETGFNYQWKKDNTNIAGETQSFYLATTAADYSVEITDANNCTSTSSNVTVTVNPLPEASITPAGPVNLQIGEQVELNANISAGLNYQWLLEGQDITDATNSSYTVIQTNKGTYNYTVVVTDIISGCQKTSNVVIINYENGAAEFTVDVTANPGVLCAGETSELTANAQGGLGSYQYTWDTQETTDKITVTPGQTTTYYVTVTDGTETVTGSVLVTVNTLPDATITPESATSFCEGGSVVLNAPKGEGYTYKWLKDGVELGTNANFIVTETGSYSVEVTSNNCKSVSSPIIVTVNIAPNATVTPEGPIKIYKGENVNIEATEKGLTYQWRKDDQDIAGATNDIYNVTESGNYTVYVTSNGCSKLSKTVVVTFGLAPCPMVTGLNTTNVKTKGATLNWNSNNASQVTYLIRLAQKGTTNYRYRKTSNLSLIFDDLLPNTTYYWAVKAYCVTKQNNLDYTDSIEFTTTNDYCAGATNLQHQNVKQHNATVKWTGTENATLYKIRYYIQGTNIYKYIKTTQTQFEFTWLKSNTTYIWQIKTVCANINKTINYNYSDQFTTLPLKKMNETTYTNDLSIYPNPNTGIFNISINKAINENAQISLYNVQGELIMQENTTENIKEFNFSDLEKGIYLLSVKTKDQISFSKVIFK